MQVTKGTWRIREQCVPGSLSSSHAWEPGNEAREAPKHIVTYKGVGVTPICPVVTTATVVKILTVNFS